MKRVSFSFVAAAAVCLTSASAVLAADSIVKLTLDGRPVDRAGGIAVRHNGVVLADVIDLTKAFDGLLTFPNRNSVTVTLNGTTVRYRVGVKSAVVNDKVLPLRVAPILRNGDVFVPLAEFVNFGGARVALSSNRADIRINANPAAPAFAAPGAAASPAMAAPSATP
jgi:hypothetical protein